MDREPGKMLMAIIIMALGSKIGRRGMEYTCIKVTTIVIKETSIKGSSRISSNMAKGNKNS
jgi:hypothetical protein